MKPASIALFLALLAPALAPAPANAQIAGAMIAPGCDARGKLVNITVGDGLIEPIDADDTLFRVRNAIGRDRAKLWLFAPDDMPFGCVQQAIALVRRAGARLTIDFIDGPKDAPAAN